MSEWEFGGFWGILQRSLNVVLFEVNQKAV